VLSSPPLICSSYSRSTSPTVLYIRRFRHFGLSYIYSLLHMMRTHTHYATPILPNTTIKLLVGFLKETKLPLRNLSRPTLLALNYWTPLSSKCLLFRRINGRKRKKSFKPFSNAIRALFASHVLPRLARSLLPLELPLPLTSKLPPPLSS
jgi:hypothetical protein